MKIKVFQEQEPKREREIFVRLIEHGDRVYLAIVDAQGKEIGGALILRINPDGTFFRCPGLKSDLGLQTDERGRIIEQ